MRLVAAGLSFHSAPLALRERAIVGTTEAPNLLRYLAGHPGVRGAAVLSTCNRTEFYVACEDDDLAAEVAQRLGRHLDPGNDELARHVVSWSDEAAVEHICRVAAGLESMVIGEAQVLGQLRAAHRVAAEAGTLSPDLDVVLRGAIEAGKRVRTQTAIGRGAGSLGEVALDLATATVGDLRGRGVLLIGAGKMSRTAARRLRDLGARVVVTSRSASAARLAAELGGEAIERTAIPEIIGGVDVVISSTSAPSTVVSARDVAFWQARRSGRQLCIVDLAVPRDVELAAGGIDGVHLIDIDELGERVAGTLDDRRRSVPEAEAVVAAAVASTMARLRDREGAAPTISALVAHAEAVRFREVERTLSGLAVDDDTRRRIDTMTRSIVGRILHAPIDTLHSGADDPEVARTVSRIFDLQPVDGDA